MKSNVTTLRAQPQFPHAPISPNSSPCGRPVLPRAGAEHLGRRPHHARPRQPRPGRAATVQQRLPSRGAPSARPRCHDRQHPPRRQRPADVGHLRSWRLSAHGFRAAPGRFHASRGGCALPVGLCRQYRPDPGHCRRKRPGLRRHDGPHVPVGGHQVRRRQAGHRVPQRSRAPRAPDPAPWDRAWWWSIRSTAPAAASLRCATSSRFARQRAVSWSPTNRIPWAPTVRMAKAWWSNLASPNGCISAPPAWPRPSPGVPDSSPVRAASSTISRASPIRRFSARHCCRTTSTAWPQRWASSARKAGGASACARTPPSCARSSTLGYNLNGSECQIVSLESGTEQNTIALRDALESRGIFGSIFCAPATPKSRALMRFSVHAGLGTPNWSASSRLPRDS
jgi:hypothetical protein